MKYLKFLKRKTRQTFSNELSIALISIILAIIAWFVISMTVYPSTPKTITDIPLITEFTSESESGLTLISCDVKNVDIQIVGNRSQVGNLDNENITARIVTDNITTSGTKKVSIKIESKNDNIEFEIKEIEPSYATIIVDKIETREFPISPEIPNITFADGKTIDRDDFSCEPSVIMITGPTAQLDKIAKCTAVSNKTAVLDTTYNLQSEEIKLYTEDGSLIDAKELSVNTSNITINIPVLTQKTVDLSFSIVNAPPNFDKDFLKFSMSAEDITLASAISSATFPESFEMGQIILNNIDVDYSTTFTVDTKDYINLSNLEAVTVTLENDNLAKKEIVINDFSVSNASANYDYNIITNSITVTIIGEAEAIEDITAKDLVADINLLNEAGTSDSFKHDLTISCPNNNRVWALGTYKVTVNRTPKTTTASSIISSNESAKTTTTDE